MKKLFFILLMFVGLVSFTQMTDIEDLFIDMTNTIKQEPSGTTYGVIENSNDAVVVNTPFGEYSIDKLNDGKYSFMGVNIKIKSKKGNIYIIESSLGEFKIDINKCTITKK